MFTTLAMDQSVTYSLTHTTGALLDPLKGITWVDDSQVAYATINKVYAWDSQPGAFVVIDFLDDEWALLYGTAHRVVTNAIDSL